MEFDVDQLINNSCCEKSLCINFLRNRKLWVL